MSGTGLRWFVYRKHRDSYCLLISLHKTPTSSVNSIFGLCGTHHQTMPCPHLHRLCLDEEDFSRSRSSEALRKISQSSVATGDDQMTWRRSRSLSDTQKTLDDAIRSLEACVNEEILKESDTRPRHYSSNDSAMGDREAAPSPIQGTSSEPSTLARHRQVFPSMDSAFSNSSVTTASDVANCDAASVGSDSAFSHTRMSSGVSISPTGTRARDSPEVASSPHLRGRGRVTTSLLSSPETVSLPALSPEREVAPCEARDTPSPSKLRLSTKKEHPLSSAGSQKEKQAVVRWGIPPKGTYSPDRSPILSSSTEVTFRSEAQLSSASSDHTPTASTNNLTSEHSSEVHLGEGTIV